MTQQTDTLHLRARAFDAAQAHERLVRRCIDEAGQSGITRLRLRCADANKARIEAENALKRAGG